MDASAKVSLGAQSKAQSAARTHVRARAATPRCAPSGTFPKGCSQKSRARRCRSRRGATPAAICALLTAFLVATHLPSAA